MFSFFRQSFRQWARSGSKPATQKKPSTRRLGCEALEDRVLLSLSGSEALVNTTKTRVQHQAATATSSNGTSVVVWTEVKSSYDSDIKAQRYSATGRKVGGEILVAGGRSPQSDPTVAMDSRGNFVVAWTHAYSSTDNDIHAAVFRSDGRKNGSEMTVATNPRNESDASVAMAGNGDFVITYTYQYNSSDLDIKGVLYSATKSVKRRFDVAETTRSESKSEVSAAADGRFAVTFVRSNDIIVKRYDRGANLKGEHTVASGTRVQTEPDVAMDNNGNALVVWQEKVGTNWNILIRSITSSGRLGSISTVQGTSANETLPSVAIDPLTRKSVVSYQSKSGTSKPVVKVTELTSGRSIIRTQTVGSALSAPSVSIGGSAHRYIIAAQSVGSKGGDSDGGIFARFGIL